MNMHRDVDHFLFFNNTNFLRAKDFANIALLKHLLITLRNTDMTSLVQKVLHCVYSVCKDNKITEPL